MIRSRETKLTVERMIFVTLNSSIEKRTVEIEENGGGASKENGG